MQPFSASYLVDLSTPDKMGRKIAWMRWVCLFLLIAPFSLLGQHQPTCDLSVSGLITDTQSQEHLIGGAVHLLESRIAVSANEAGEYSIGGLCPGKYTMVCSYIGHQPDTVTIQLEQLPLSINFHLKEEQTTLEAVTIAGQKEILPPTQAVGTLQGAELEKTRGRSLGESLREIAGVNTLQSGPTISKPVIQGLHSNRILILNNGIRQEGQQWGSEHAPEIDPFVATRLSVIKGAAAVRYGADAIGGVVIVEPPALSRQAGMSGELNLVGISNGRGGAVSGTLEGGSKKWPGLGWRAQGTYKRLGDVQAANYNLSNSSMQELNFSGAIGYNWDHFGAEAFYSRFSTDLAILRSAHIGSLDDLEDAIDTQTPITTNTFSYQIGYPRQEVSHDLVKLNSYYRFAQAGKLSVQYGGQFNSRREFDVRRGGRSDTPELYMQLSTHTLDVIYEHKERQNWHGSLGMNGSLQDNYNVPITNIRPLIPQYRSTGLGLFWIERWVKERVELELGFRYDYRSMDFKIRDRNQQLLTPQYTFHNTSGSLGLVYRLSTHTTFRSNLATAWRPPNAAELFSDGLHHGTGTIERGDANLQTEKAYKWINTLQFNNLNAKEGKGILLEMSAYYNYINNYIYLSPSDVELTIRGAFPVFRYQQTNATFAGLDASLQWLLSKKISFQSKTSLVRAKDVLHDDYLIFIPSDRFENGFTFRLPHVGKWKDLYVSAGATYVARQFRAPQVFSVRQLREAVASPDDNLTIPQNNFDFTPAPSGYLLLNLEGGIALPMKKGHMSVSIGVQNLLNQAYRDYMNRFRYYSDDIGRNFTLRLRYQFYTNPG
jgi:iron complex outermembrane recepter protein